MNMKKKKKKDSEEEEKKKKEDIINNKITLLPYHYSQLRVNSYAPRVDCEYVKLVDWANLRSTEAIRKMTRIGIGC